MHFLHSGIDVLSIVQLQQMPQIQLNETTSTEVVKMAFAANITSARGNGISGFAAQVVASVKDALARRRLYNETYNELQTLSNRELADLGINRSMIRSIALEAANAK